METLGAQLDLNETEAWVDIQEKLPNYLLDCDTLPELYEYRQAAFWDAVSELEDNKQRLQDGDFESIPMAIDVLGTARTLSAIEQTHGRDSQQYREGFTSMVKDGARQIAEAERKNSWEHFPKLYQPRDPVTGDYLSHGISIRETVRRGLSPLAPPEEQPIRILEDVEEGTNRYVGEHEALGQGSTLLTIKECPDYVIRDFQRGKSIAHGGYVPAIEKLVLYGVEFTEQGRYHEQLAISGKYITHEVILAVLKDRSAIEPNANLSKTEVRAKQFIETSGDGLMGLMRDLDQKASEIYGLSIFMGEVVEADHPKDYELAIQESAARQLDQKSKAIEVAEFLRNLEGQKVDSALAELLLNIKLKKDMFNQALTDTDKAAMMFDEDTAEAIKDLNRQRALGLSVDGDGIAERIYRSAPEPSYCGAGSCGLESVQTASVEATKARRLGLSGELIHDTVRPCPSCHELAVYYDGTGSKGCINCNKKDIKSVSASS
jgi:hypothetical protein